MINDTIDRLKKVPANQRAMVHAVVNMDGAEGAIYALTISDSLAARETLRGLADKAWQDMAVKHETGTGCPWILEEQA